MSTSYIFEVHRKADNKTIGKFLFDRIKNLGDVYGVKLELDPESFRYKNDSTPMKKFDVETIDKDIAALDSKIKMLEYDMYVNKLLLIPQAKSAEVQRSMKEDLQDQDELLADLRYAVQSLQGLKMIVETIVENAIRITDSNDDECSIAYKYNAEDLPKTPEGHSPMLWISDVEIAGYAE